MITSPMIDLTSVRKRVQQVSMDLGPEMASEMILAIKELDGVASSRLGHTFHLVASSFHHLSEKRRKGAVNRIQA